MTLDEFTTGLRSRRWAKPFEPFYIELADGRLVLVTYPDGIGFNGRYGSYWGPLEADDEYDFTCDEVVSFRKAVPAPTEQVVPQ